jgi:hypothetical protein
MRARACDGAEDVAALALALGRGRRYGVQRVVAFAWLRARGFVLVILEAADVLRDADDDEYALLLSVLSNTGAAMSQPTEFRAALPFHVVLQAAPQRAPELEARLAGAGHRLPPAAF